MEMVWVPAHVVERLFVHETMVELLLQCWRVRSALFSAGFASEAVFWMTQRDAVASLGELLNELERRTFHVCSAMSEQGLGSDMWEPMVGRLWAVRSTLSLLTAEVDELGTALSLEVLGG